MFVKRLVRNFVVTTKGKDPHRVTYSEIYQFMEENIKVVKSKIISANAAELS